jgi:hypothetical protein
VTAVELASAKGSPGVTTSALLLAALLPGSVLVEADPAGGDLRTCLTDPTGQPLRPEIGVVSLLAAHRTAQHMVHGAADRSLLAHAQQLPGDLPVLVGPGSAAHADALLPAWPQLAAAVAAHPGLALVDVGRLDPQHTGSWALVDQCALTVFVTVASVSAVAHCRDLLTALRSRRRPAGVLVIGSAAEQQQVHEALAPHGAGWVGRLTRDPDAAGQLLSGVWSRRLDRSPLLTAGRRVAAELHEQLLLAEGSARETQHISGVDGLAPSWAPTRAEATAGVPS